MYTYVSHTRVFDSFSYIVDKSTEVESINPSIKIITLFMSTWMIHFILDLRIIISTDRYTKSRGVSTRGVDSISSWS